MGPGGRFDFNAIISACLNLLRKSPETGQLAQVLAEARRNYVPPAPGYPPPADREASRHSATMVEKKSGTLRTRVRRLATAEQNRDANEKALVEARSHVHKTLQEPFARFSSGCPLDNDVCAGQGAGPAAAAGTKDVGQDVVMGELNDVVIAPPGDVDQENKDLWQRHRELEKKMQQLRGEMSQAQKSNLGKP